MSSNVPADKINAEAYKTEHDDWKLKVRIKCQECHGVGWWDWEGPVGSGDRCEFCNGKGFLVEEVHPDDIDKLLERKESQDFKCICERSEKILRPKEGQIPSGWLNWDGNYICNSCKYKVMLAALQGASMKIAQIKEPYNGG
jgi:hypothetical protein